MRNRLIEFTKGKTFDRKFLNCLVCDGILTLVTGQWEIDIVATDAKLSALDPEYNDLVGTYKGQPCSMKEYVSLKYGKNHIRLIEDLL